MWGNGFDLRRIWYSRVRMTSVQNSVMPKFGPGRTEGPTLLTAILWKFRTCNVEDLWMLINKSHQENFQDHTTSSLSFRCRSFTQLDPQIMSSIQKMLFNCAAPHFCLTSICHYWLNGLDEAVYGLLNLQAIRSCWSSEMTPPNVSGRQKEHFTTCRYHINFRAHLYYGIHHMGSGF